MSALDDDLTLALADVPADHKTVLVLIATADSVKCVTVVKISKSWEVKSEVSFGKGSHLEAGVQFKTSW